MQFEYTARLYGSSRIAKCLFELTPEDEQRYLKDWSERHETGKQGSAYSGRVVTVDGAPVEGDTPHTLLLLTYTSNLACPEIFPI